MMRIFKDTNIDFIEYRHIAIRFSILLTLIAIVSVIYHGGFNYSIDFVGGTLVQVKFDNPVSRDLTKIRETVSALGYGSPEVKVIGAEENNELQITIRKKI